MKTKLYRTVSVEERLPKKDVRYLVLNHGKWHEANYCEQYSFHEEMTNCAGITHWLDKCKLPTEEDAIAKAKYLTSHSNNEGWKEITQFGFITGVKWLFDHIKKGNKK